MKLGEGLAAIGAGVAIGLGIGWRLWVSAPVVETPAPSVRQADSSLVLARRPDTTVKIVHRIPPGFTPERHIELAVQPRPPIALTETGRVLSTNSGTVVVAPSLVRIRLTLGVLRDGTRRVIASSPDGEILDSISIDIPLAHTPEAKKFAWSVGPTYDVLRGRWGGAITRDVGYARIFAAGEPGSIDRGAQLKIGAMIRF